MALDCVPLWIQAVYFALQFRVPIFPKVIFGTKFKFSENQNTLRFHYTWPNAITSTNIKTLCVHIDENYFSILVHCDITYKVRFQGLSHAPLVLRRSFCHVSKLIYRDFLSRDIPELIDPGNYPNHFRM